MNPPKPRLVRLTRAAHHELLLSATIAIVTDDIKEWCFAYPTVSQLAHDAGSRRWGRLGWQVCSPFDARFLKAPVFRPRPASVIYGCHHEQENDKDVWRVRAKDVHIAGLKRCFRRLGVSAASSLRRI